MRRLLKIIPKESAVPEHRMFIITENGGYAWNGTLGIRYTPEKIGKTLCELVKQHGAFAVIDTMQFLKVLSSIENVEKATIDTNDSVLVLKASKSRITIKVPISMEVDPQCSHLQIPWDSQGRPVPVTEIWQDTSDLVTNDALQLWGDVVGVYTTESFAASFDFGILLYKKRPAPPEGKKRKPLTAFCPLPVLQLGLTRANKALLLEDGAMLVSGDDATYYCNPIVSTSVLNSLMELRTVRDEGREYNVALTYAGGVWKRAKMFCFNSVRMEVKGGQITVSGGSWREVLGTTAAPDRVLLTRLSLLQRWVSSTQEHRIVIKEEDDGENVWYLLGRTKKGTEFFALLADVTQSEVEDEKEEKQVQDEVSDDGGGLDFDGEVLL